MTLESPKETAKDIANRYAPLKTPLKTFKPKPKICSYPLCDAVAKSSFHKMFLCPEHIEFARFIKWFYYKLGLS